MKLKKECIEITKKDVCNNHIPEDTTKRCIFKNGLCEEDYITCEKYNEKIEESQRKQVECELIAPIYNDRKVYKCSYDIATKTCNPKIVFCEDYKGQDEDYCTSLSVNVNNTSTYKCALINNKCVSQFKDCETYNGQGTDKEMCESIKLYNDNYKRCFLEKDKDCVRNLKLCSDYLGEDEEECTTQFRGSDTTKVCAFENNKCVEKSKFKFCSEYRGTDKNICESIQPYIYDESAIDFSSKCEYGNYGCQKVKKKCEEAKNENECSSIIPTDNTNKICIFKDNACIEQYKSCQLYQNNEEKIYKSVCESIIPLTNPELNKCEFNENGGVATCIEKRRLCSDFQSEFLKTQCLSIVLPDEKKMFIF